VVVLAKEDLHVSVAENRLLAVVDGDVGVLEAARALALEEFVPWVAAGDSSTITALSILDGVCRRARG
jgi:hypothetical protein